MCRMIIRQIFFFQAWAQIDISECVLQTKQILVFLDWSVIYSSCCRTVTQAMSFSLSAKKQLSSVHIAWYCGQGKTVTSFKYCKKGFRTIWNEAQDFLDILTVIMRLVLKTSVSIISLSLFILNVHVTHSFSWNYKPNNWILCNCSLIIFGTQASFEGYLLFCWCIFCTKEGTDNASRDAFTCYTVKFLKRSLMSFLGTEFFMQQQNITLRPAVVAVQLCSSQSFLFFHQVIPNIFHKTTS